MSTYKPNKEVALQIDLESMPAELLPELVGAYRRIAQLTYIDYTTKKGLSKDQAAELDDLKNDPEMLAAESEYVARLLANGKTPYNRGRKWAWDIMRLHHEAAAIQAKADKAAKKEAAKEAENLRQKKKQDQEAAVREQAAAARAAERDYIAQLQAEAAAKVEHAKLTYFSCPYTAAWVRTNRKQILADTPIGRAEQQYEAAKAAYTKACTQGSQISRRATSIALEAAESTLAAIQARPKDYDEEERLRRAAVALCMPLAKNLIRQINGTIPKAFAFKLRPIDITEHHFRLDHDVEQTLDSFRKYASRAYNKAHMMLRREAEHHAKLRGEVLDQVSDDLHVAHIEREALLAMVARETKLACGKTLDEVRQSPEARAAERAAQTNGLIKYLWEDQKCVALALTMTAPGEYHPKGRPGVTNTNWHHAGCPDARASKDWLQDAWRILQKKLYNKGIAVAGLKTVEPHKDGCAHSHAILMCQPHQAEEVQEAFWGVFANVRANQINQVNSMEGAIKFGHYIQKCQRHGDPKYERAQAWYKVNRIRSFDFFGVKGHRGVFRALFKKWHADHKASGLPPIDRSVTRHESISRIDGVLNQMMEAVGHGNCRAAFELFNAHGKNLRTQVLTKVVYHEVFDLNGDRLEGETREHMIPTRTVGLRLNDEYLDLTMWVPMAGKPLNTGVGHLVERQQDYILAVQEATHLPHLIREVTPRVHVYLKPPRVDMPELSEDEYQQYLKDEAAYTEEFDAMLQVVAARDSIDIHWKICAIFAEAIPSSIPMSYQFKPPQTQQRSYYAAQ